MFSWLLKRTALEPLAQKNELRIFYANELKSWALTFAVYFLVRGGAKFFASIYYTCLAILRLGDYANLISFDPWILLTAVPRLIKKDSDEKGRFLFYSSKMVQVFTPARV